MNGTKCPTAWLLLVGFAPAHSPQLINIFYYVRVFFAGWLSFKEIGMRNAQQSSTVLESISFAFSYFETINEPAA